MEKKALRSASIGECHNHHAAVMQCAICFCAVPQNEMSYVQPDISYRYYVTITRYLVVYVSRYQVRGRWYYMEGLVAHVLSAPFQVRHTPDGLMSAGQDRLAFHSSLS